MKYLDNANKIKRLSNLLMNKLITLIISISGIWLLVSSIILLSLNTETLEAEVASTVKTKTPIKHLVVIFQENVSFDHYFATYPNATNPSGEPNLRPVLQHHL